MKIRIAKEEDSESIVKIMKEANKKDAEWSNQRVKKYISLDFHDVIVCIENKKIVGYLGIKALFNDEEIIKRFGNYLGKFSQVTWIGVLPEYQNRGIARRLLLFAEDWSKKNKKEGYWLECGEKLVSFYRHIKLKEYGRYENQKGTRYIMIKY